MITNNNDDDDNDDKILLFFPDWLPENPLKTYLKKEREREKEGDREMRKKIGQSVLFSPQPVITALRTTRKLVFLLDTYPVLSRRNK